MNSCMPSIETPCRKLHFLLFPTSAKLSGCLEPDEKHPQGKPTCNANSARWMFKCTAGLYLGKKLWNSDPSVAKNGAITCRNSNKYFSRIKRGFACIQSRFCFPNRFLFFWPCTDRLIPEAGAPIRCNVVSSGIIIGQIIIIREFFLHTCTMLLHFTHSLATALATAIAWNRSATRACCKRNLLNSKHFARHSVILRDTYHEKSHEISTHRWTWIQGDNRPTHIFQEPRTLN